MLKIVVDASTLVSAALMPRSVPRQVFQHIVTAHAFVLSRATLGEITEVLARPKFDRHASLAIRMEFVDMLRQFAVFHDAQEDVQACRDRKDDKYLALAVSAEADLIVSSDDDLLVPHPFRGIPILSPRAFLDQESASR